jgi:hypothetical protein
MKKTIQQTVNETPETLREEFLNPNELFLLSYLVKFNRTIEQKWQKQQLGNFSRY